MTHRVQVHSLTRQRELVQVFCKEFVTWKALNHPNVLPLLGVMMTDGRFAMVSEWMAEGNINHFVAKHWNTNRFELVSSPCELLRSSLIVDGHVLPHS